MQTFLPYPEFDKSAKSLDNRRLGKQRVECLQILQVLSFGPYQRKLIVPQHGKYGIWEKAPEKEYLAFIKETGNYPFGFIYRKTPWYNHPAVQMWKGYKIALVRYGWHMCNEWMKRGFRDTLTHKILSFVSAGKNVDDFVNPPWMNKSEFHLSHQSNLIRKNPNYYRIEFGKEIPDNLPYYWPTKNKC